MEKFIAGGFGLLIGGLGLYTAIVYLRNIFARKSSNFTKAKVVERGVFDLKTQSAKHFSPLVKYSYQVESNDFINDSYYPKGVMNPPRGTEDWAKKETAKFPDDVTIFYNPHNPQDSFLKFPSKTLFYVIGIASIVVILFSVFALTFGVD